MTIYLFFMGHVSNFAIAWTSGFLESLRPVSSLNAKLRLSWFVFFWFCDFLLHVKDPTILSCFTSHFLPLFVFLPFFRVSHNHSLCIQAFVFPSLPVGLSVIALYSCVCSPVLVCPTIPLININIKNIILHYCIMKFLIVKIHILKPWIKHTSS